MLHNTCCVLRAACCVLHAACCLLLFDCFAQSNLARVTLNGNSSFFYSPAYWRAAPTPGAPSLSLTGEANLLRSGPNLLEVQVDVGAAGDPCGVYVTGVASPLVPHATMPIHRSMTGLERFHFSHLATGALVVIEQSATNRAGLAASSLSGRIFIHTSHRACNRELSRAAGGMCG